MVDSTLEVKDSATFRKRVRIEQDVIIMGKTFMRDHAVANQNLRVQNGFRVDGISRFYDNVFADSTLRVGKLGLFENNVRVNGQLRTYGINNLFGISRFHDDLRLLNLNHPSGQNQDGFMMLSGNGLVKREDVLPTVMDTNSQILLMDGNGNIQKSGTNSLRAIMYEGPCLHPISDDPVEKSHQQPNPTWANKPGVLWTGLPCPASVGINTDNPDAALEVVGKTHTSSLLVTSLNLPSSPSTQVVEVINNGDKIFQINSSGLVRAREIKVNQDSWPDYVFQKDYDLLSIEELRTFIDQNQHLPGMPTAETVEKEGVNLGVMDHKLLQKVEELTLYILNQEEQLKEQKQQSARQKEALHKQKEINQKLEKRLDALEKKYAQLENEGGQ